MTTRLIASALLAAAYTAAAQPPTPAVTTPLPAHFLSVLALQAADDKPKPADPLPEGKGKDVTKRLCSGCHAVTVFAAQRHTSDRWSSIIDNMVSKGMEASDDDLNTINTYLATYLAPPAQDAAPATTPDAPPPAPPQP